MRKSLIEATGTVKSGKIEPVYFLNGDDFFLQHFFIDEVEKGLKKKKSKPERVYLVPEVDDHDAILRELDAVSLFPQPKLFVLQNPVRITGKNREELLSYCQSPNPDNCLVIIIDKYDPRGKLIKDLSRTVGRINTSAPFPEKMGSWVNYLLKEYNLTATDDAIDRLLELSGDSVYHLYNEMQKIALGVEQGSDIEEEDVVRYAGWKRSYFPWQFLDAVGTRNYVDALLIGKRLLEQGSDISSLVAFLTGLFQALLFSHMDDGNRNGKQLQVFWLSHQVRRRLPRYRKLYDRDRIHGVLRLLASADRRVKSSGGDPNSILIPLIYRVTMNGD